MIRIRQMQALMSMAHTERTLTCNCKGRPPSNAAQQRQHAGAMQTWQKANPSCLQAAITCATHLKQALQPGRRTAGEVAVHDAARVGVQNVGFRSRRTRSRTAGEVAVRDAARVGGSECRV